LTFGYLVVLLLVPVLEPPAGGLELAGLLPLLLQAATTKAADAATTPHLIPREMRKTDSLRE